MAALINFLSIIIGCILFGGIFIMFLVALPLIIIARFLSYLDDHRNVIV